VSAHRLYVRRQLCHGGADGAFGAAHVQHDGTGLEQRPDRAQLVEDIPYRRAEDDDVGLGKSAGQIQRASLHKAERERRIQATLAPCAANHLSTHAAGAQGRCQRAAHEPQTDDGDPRVA